MPESIQFSFCEPSGASTLSKEHIRRVGPEGIKPGGAIPGPALCGHDVSGGWDIPNLPVTPSNFDTAAETNPTCAACVLVWEHITDTDPNRPALGTTATCRTCGKPITFQTVFETGYLPRVGWSDQAPRDALVCFRAANLTHSPSDATEEPGDA